MASTTDLEHVLHERWMKLTSDINADVHNKWWKIIQSRYTEPTRKYHNLGHLQRMFEHLDSNCENITSVKALSYAIFFHDLVYDVRSHSNAPESVELFQNFCVESGNQEDTELIEQVIDLILLSESHCTEAHVAKDMYGTKDRHYFLDFDVSILGADAKEYKEYAEKIRGEYEYLSQLKYNDLRKKVLMSFLQIPNIFATKIFRDKYEEQARKNITEEISELDKENADL